MRTPRICRILGFQLERFVAGKQIGCESEHSSVEHLHTVQVGGYHVLFQAEVDGIFEDESIAITLANLGKMGHKKIFQIISTAVRGCAMAKWVGRQSKKGSSICLRTWPRKTLIGSWEAGEQRILCGMNEIRDQMATTKDGQTYKVTFRGNAIHNAKIVNVGRIVGFCHCCLPFFRRIAKQVLKRSCSVGASRQPRIDM